MVAREDGTHGVWTQGGEVLLFCASNAEALGYTSAGSTFMLPEHARRLLTFSAGSHISGHHLCEHERMTMATILYARVSTTEQNITHQKAQAVAAGFAIDEVIADHGVSGVSTRLADRPEGRRLFDKLRAGDTLVVRWVDRLGRNYQDVTDTIRDFMRRGVIIRTVINGLTFDGATKDPMQEAVRDALIAFMAATAQAQAEATKEAQRAGIAAARENITAYRGRKPSYCREDVDKVLSLHRAGTGTPTIAKEAGLSRSAVQRIVADPAGALKALERWEEGAAA